MPSKRRRRRERRASNEAAGGGGGAAEGPAQQSPAPARQRRASSRKKGRSSSGINQNLLLYGGGGVLVALVVAVIAWVALSGAGAAANFDFTLYQGEEILGGDSHNFQDILATDKPVVLNFWGGDCPPCRAEMPAFQRIWDAHQDDVTFVGIDVGVMFGLGTRQSAQALLVELGITYPAGPPKNRAPINNYNVNALPSTFFFDAEGGLFRRWDGAIPERNMNQIVDDLLDTGS